MPPLDSPLPPSSFPIPVTKRASLVARETGFFHGDVGTRGKGRAALFRPVMKDSPHACLIARLMVPNPTAEPIYHSLIMFNGASDTLILPVLSRCAASLRGHLSYCCTAFLMSTAETTDSQTKHWRYTCVSAAVTETRLTK